MIPFENPRKGRTVVIGTKYGLTAPEHDGATSGKSLNSSEPAAPATDDELDEISVCTPEDMERALESATPEMRARPREKGEAAG